MIVKEGERKRKTLCDGKITSTMPMVDGNLFGSVFFAHFWYEFDRKGNVDLLRDERVYGYIVSM